MPSVNISVNNIYLNVCLSTLDKVQFIPISHQVKLSLPTVLILYGLYDGAFHITLVMRGGLYYNFFKYTKLALLAYLSSLHSNMGNIHCVNKTHVTDIKFGLEPTSAI